MTRRAKRAKLDSSICSVPHSTITKSLNKLSKASLCTLAAAWISEQGATKRTLEDSDDDEDSQENKQSYEDMKDDSSVKKPLVLKSIQRDWRSGFTYSQLAQVDVQNLLDKPNSKSWNAYQLIHDDDKTRTYATSQQVLTRLRSSLSPYFNHHLYLHTTAALTIFRLQLLPTSLSLPSTSALSSAIPTPLVLVLLPQTPYLLLPAIPSSLASPPILLQCLSSSICTQAQELRELDLKGKDIYGMRSMLLERMSAGGSGMGRWTKGKGEGGGPLVPAQRLVVRDDSVPTSKADNAATTRDDAEVQQAREKEVGEVFGREELPRLERLDYEISLPYPNDRPPPSQNAALQPPPFLLRFEGTHVLAGLRAAVAAGFADAGGLEQKGGLPSWLGEVASEGRNMMRVGVEGIQRD